MKIIILLLPFLSQCQRDIEYQDLDPMIKNGRPIGIYGALQELLRGEKNIGPWLPCTDGVLPGSLERKSSYYNCYNGKYRLESCDLRMGFQKIGMGVDCRYFKGNYTLAPGDVIGTYSPALTINSSKCKDGEVVCDPKRPRSFFFCTNNAFKERSCHTAKCSSEKGKTKCIF